MLSAPQIKALNGRLWPAACRAQGWPRNDREAVAQGFASERAFRLGQLSEIVGRALTSSSELGKVEEFTRVKDRLLMLADNLKGAAEDGDPVPNALRTRRWVALRDIQCLRLYVDEGYVREILQQRFARGGVCPSVFATLPLAEIVAEFKDERALTQLNYTLAARLQKHRSDAGHTLQEMRALAGVDQRPAVSGKREANSEQRSAERDEPVAVGAEAEPF